MAFLRGTESALSKISNSIIPNNLNKKEGSFICYFNVNFMLLKSNPFIDSRDPSNKKLLTKRDKRIMKKKVLIVCTGNACRSQMAEGYIKHFANEFNEVVSAGVDPHGLHPLAVQVMAEDGLDITDHFSKNLAQVPDDDYDYAISVCLEAKRDVSFKKINAKQKIHIEFKDPAAIEGDMETKLEGFREVREQIKKYVLRFIGREIIPQSQKETSK